jgi:hypothetical protein
MRSIRIALCVFCVLWAASPALAQSWGDDTPPAPVVTPDVAPDATPIVSDSLKASAKSLSRRPGFTWKKRRELGLTVPNMIRKLSEMDAAGELDDLDQSEVSILLTSRLRGDNPVLYASEAANDREFLEKLLKWVQFMLPLILLFL